jgi:ABC-2 type transport system ATP-binding protein
MLLAKGFSVKTPVFFLDQPTASLDPHGAREVRTFIRKELIGTSNTSAILTTHRMSEAEELCDRIAIMNQGKIIACGTSTELKKKAGNLISLEIRCLSIPQASIDALRETEGITAAAVSSVGEESLEKSLRLHLRDSSLEGKAVDTLRRYEASVVSIEREEPTLEDAFLALTQRRLE